MLDTDEETKSFILFKTGINTIYYAKKRVSHISRLSGKIKKSEIGQEYKKLVEDDYDVAIKNDNPEKNI